MIHALSESEEKVLVKIARKTGMDCWFTLRCSGQYGYYVVDLENHKAISLARGIKNLVDGMIEENLDLLSKSEMLVLIQLLGRLIEL